MQFYLNADAAAIPYSSGVTGLKALRISCVSASSEALTVMIAKIFEAVRKISRW